MSRKQPSAVLPGGSDGKRVCIFDRRLQNSRAKEEWLDISGLDLNAFRRIVSEIFSVPARKSFVLVTTERRVLDADEYLRLSNDATLYMLQSQDQVLEIPTQELINFTPHHDTVVESGTFKYYDSEGKKSLPYALADLVDNALTATANNTGTRTIEIRMLFDETQGKAAVIVLDNGCGMTSKQLNNWAVYKLSKFTRDAHRDQGGYVRPDHFPRSLNSDISYFGVGGKQAAFYIGKSTRMISKSLTSPDVHELVLSKSLFEKKEKNNEDTYSTTILNRKPGDFTHINNTQESFLHKLITEECNKDSFTAIVITEVLQEHIQFLKEEFEVWTRQLAHIYHYYIHGVNGNTQGLTEANGSDSNHMSKIDILITLMTKNRASQTVNLRSIDTDMQSQYIKAAVSTFEFKACTNPDAGIVEGIIRYHPFLYENETYPKDPDAEPDHVKNDDNDDDQGDYTNDLSKKRKKPIFECFWNGRLIPYTTILEFDWCSQPPKGDKVPPECYNRISGVLFTDDTFKVTENKLTFIDLEKKLRNKDTIFTFVVKGQKQQRTNLQRDFGRWLQDCHEQFDKQVKFMNYTGTITRTDIPTKRKQHPWATFTSVEWHGKVYEAGQYVKTQKTLPIYHGKVKQFLVYGSQECVGDVFAPGGHVEICLEPKGLYDSTKIFQLSKLDRSATMADIKNGIKLDSAKLPDKLQVEWPNKNPWEDNSTQTAGNVFGPVQIEIVNKKGETISRISPGGQQGRKLSIELKLMHHDNGEEKEVKSYIAQHSKWGFWFKEIDFVDLGKYTMYFNTLLTDTNVCDFGERRLPHYKLRFTIKAGKAVQFDVGAVSASLFVGVPFDIPLEMKDLYGHPVEANADTTLTLQSNELDLTYEEVKREGSILLLKNVKASGKLKHALQLNHYDLIVSMDGCKEHSKILSINLLPGKPHSIHVLPKNDPVTVENGEIVQFKVIIQDEAGNATAHSKMSVQCQVPNQPPASINCSSGSGNYVTKPIKVSIVNGKPQCLKVQFSVPSCRGIKEVIRELLMLPSKQAHCMKLYQKDTEYLELKNNGKIHWIAGGVLENLYFKLYDEANEEVSLTEAVTSKIKVNWTGKLNQNELIEGKLPDVHVLTKVCEEHFYQVSYQDQSVSFSFVIVPIPDEAAGLKATVPNCSVKLGERLRHPITLELVDQYDNISKTMTPSCVDQITVDGDGLDKTCLTIKFQKDSCSALVTGVCFTGGTPGHRDICFTFRRFSYSAKVPVTEGVPAKLNLISGPKEPLYILNEREIPTPFLIQLCDKWNNPSPDQRVVVKIRPSPPDLKVHADILSRPVDAKGQASFTVVSVSGPKGYYQLNFEGIFNKEPIEGPSVNLTVLPDPNKAVSLNVQYDTATTFIAGELFPVFSVTVMSDGGSPITGLSPAAVSMWCWKGVLAGKTAPNNALEFQCTKPMENENKSSFYFREKPIPEDAGKYTVQFCLREHRKKMPLYSEQIIINVVANKPVKLAPDTLPTAQVVSYCQELDKRILFENMTLNIVDQYGNLAGQRQNGEVEICIKNMDSESTEPHPLFEDKTDCFQIQLIEGKAQVKRLAVMKNSPGKHGVTYVVVCRPLLSPESPEPLESFEFQFSFSNDAQKHERLVALSCTREKIMAQIRTSTGNVTRRKSILEEHRGLCKSASDRENCVREELSSRNIHLPQNTTPVMVDNLISAKCQLVRRIEETPRRICTLPNEIKDQDILGKVGHLAFVEKDEDAWVISWQIRGDMDCVVTTTHRAAQRVHEMTRGKQEVMPIENINETCRRPLRPLPHLQKGFAPTGNPVYAVDVLIFPQYKEQCEIVFRNILQSTILIDDLESANNYRHLVVSNKLPCPTILTRQGQRVSSNAKFGGSNNTAPPRKHLQMLGSPLPDCYHSLIGEIALLKKYRVALDKKLKNEEEFVKECAKHEPAIKQTESELMIMSRQLEETERQLETPLHSLKRDFPSTERLGDPTSKRSKSASSAQYT